MAHPVWYRGAQQPTGYVSGAEPVLDCGSGSVDAGSFLYTTLQKG